MAKSAIVVAVTQNAEGLCLCLWDESQSTCVRPIPDDRSGFGGYFWKRVPPGVDSIGASVTYTPIGRDPETSAPHCHDDVLCTLSKGSVPTLSQSQLFTKVSASACDSLDNAWPPDIRHDKDGRFVNVKAAEAAGSRSFAPVMGSVIRFYEARADQGSPLRADIAVGGRLLCDVPCTSKVLRADSCSHGDIVNRHAVLVMGLARPQHSSVASDECSKCTMLLIGVVVEPEAPDTHADDPLLLAHVFLLRERPEDDTKAFSYLKSFNEFLMEASHDKKMHKVSKAIESWYLPKQNATELSQKIQQDGVQVLYFEGHSCCLVVETVNKKVRVFVIEPRASKYGTSFELTDRYESKDVKFKEWISSPTVAIEADAKHFDKALCDYVLLLQSQESPIPEDARQPRSPVLVLEWLLVQLQGVRLDVHSRKKSVHVEDKDKSGKKVVWSRSQHYLILKSVVHLVLRNCSGLNSTEADVTYKKLIAQYVSWMCFRQLALLRNNGPDGAVHANLRLLMEMLEKLAQKVAKLARMDADVETLVSRCETLRGRLEDAYTHRLQCVSGKYSLPSLAGLQVMRPGFEISKQLMEKIESPQEPEKPSSLKMRSTACKNLRMRELPPSSPTLSTLHTWMENAATSSTADKQLLLRHFEAFVFTQKLEALELHELTTLDLMLTKYLAVIGSFKEQLEVEQHSLVTLVIWVIFCMGFLTARKEHPNLMRGYGVPISTAGLRHLLLRDRRAMECAQQLHECLGSHQTCRPLFSLQSSKYWYSLNFALAFAKENASMCDLWEVECRDAERRETNYYAEVKRREVKAAQLESDLQIARDDWCAAPYPSNESRRLHNRCQTLQRQLQANLEAPEPVIQPLPQNRDSALQVIFFLQIPMLFKHVTKLALRSQQCLASEILPSLKAKDFKESSIKIDDNYFHVNLAEHYNKHSSRSASIADETLWVMSADKVPGKKTLRGSLDPIYYPNLRMELGWKFNGCFVNPFLVPESITLNLFVKKLPAHAKMLQWMMPLPSSPESDRSNLVITRQCQMPRWLDKAGFLTFGEVRAWPHQQIRRILGTLCDRSLPLTDVAVHKLLEQALFQLGPCGDEGLAWKADLACSDWQKEFSESLKMLADELIQKPRDHSSVLVLSRIAAYIAQWSGSPGEPCRALVRVAQGWAARIGEQIEKAVDNPDSKDRLRAKKCLFEVYALLAYETIELNASDAENVFQLIIAVCEALVFDASRLQPELEVLIVSVESLLAKRIHELLKFVTSEMQMLTRLVQQVVADAPEAMPWKPLDRTACFEAECEGRLFSVNLLHGIILVNGLPLNRLPDAILEHALYKRTFGQARFEVTHANGWFSTARFIDGCMYDFTLTSNGLRVVETDKDKCSCELVPNEDCEMLPPRLRKKHSHWVHRDSGSLLLRNVSFRDKEPSFLVKLRNPCDGCCICLRIQERDDIKSQKVSMLASWESKLDEQLVPIQDGSLEQLVSVLTKFEDRNYIHVYVENGQRDVRIVEFPRFELSFELKEGELRSCEFRGYCLGKLQQLPDTLLGFSQYLVLERSSDVDVQLAALKIVVPLGKVICGLPAKVDPRGKYAHFDVNGFGQLAAESVESRLHLACLYAATSLKIPDRRVELTGVEQAMALVRQSWKQAPFDKFEADRLQNLTDLACTSPPPGHYTQALNLLCLEVRKSSSEVAFLHDEACQKGNKVELPFELVRDYWRRKVLCEPNHRQVLTDEEEHRLLEFTFAQPTSMKDIPVARSWLQHARRLLFDAKCFPNNFESAFLSAFYNEVSAFSTSSVQDLCDPSEWPHRWLGAYSQIRKDCLKDAQAARGRQLDISYYSALPLCMQRQDCSIEMTLAAVLWLITLQPKSFPSVPFMLNRTMPGVANQTIAQHEIQGLVRDNVSSACQQHYDEDYYDFQDRKTQIVENAATEIWVAFCQAELDVSMRPNKPDLFCDTSRCKGLTFSSRSANHAPGTGQAWIEIERLYRVRSLAIGLQSFLKEVATAAILVRSEVRPAHIADDKLLAESVKQRQDIHILQNQNPGLSPVTRVHIEQKEEVVASLSNCFSLDKESRHEPCPAFPLNASYLQTTLAKAIVGEFKESWECHHSKPDNFLGPSQEVPGSMQDGLLKISKEVLQDRLHLENYLKWAVNALPGNAEGIRLKVLRLAHMAPTPTFNEIFRQALPEIRNLAVLNPFWTIQGQTHVLQAVLGLLQMSVLEAKIQRLCAWQKAGQGAIPFLLQELKVTRKWSVDKHPAWLVFEAEQRLQIRPAQYDVAMRLIDYPSEVLQLNMGEGKTRVIVPMLLLHWADKAAQTVVRVNVLTPLLGEMYEYLHRVMGGLLGRRVYVLPFHRNVSISVERLEMIRKQMLRCQSGQGILLTAPEHRLSMQLKLHELHMKDVFDHGGNGLWRTLAKVLQAPMRDLLDESDEILRHKYQLIYAVGSMLPLAEGKSRWEVCQLLLRCLHHDKNVQSLLRKCSEAAIFGTADAEAFVPIRLLASKELDSLMPDLNRRLCDLAFEGENYEFAFLRSWATTTALRDFVTDPSKGEADVPQEAREDTQLWPVLLALRGYLACGVLQHALMKRHRVEYGVNVHGRKQLAVPFRGKDTPSERSEFGHPDMALVLTNLSYYYDGLSMDQVRQAFIKLLAGGPNERKDLYNMWLVLSQKRMPEEVFKRLSNVDKIDTSNEQQMHELSAHFAKNMETVNFWLTQCVFPSETTQFPQRLVANAWHLAESTYVHGFSGTKDNHWVLPCQLTQMTLGDLKGTDGKMMQILLQNPQYMEVGNDWESVLEASLKYSALIDAGALMTGIDNLGAARCALRSRPNLPGVAFFDDRRRRGQWSVLDHFGRVMSEQKSAVRPRECFAYYDQSRSRGSDLKLDQYACACVTLGTAICKDALMQACGRMRMLGRGQTLIFLGTSEITQKIKTSCACEKVTSKEILQWVLQNSVSAMDDALVEWARQGTSFAATRDCTKMLLGCENAEQTVAKVCAQDEFLQLSDFYRFPLEPQCGADVVCSHIRAEMDRVQGHLSLEADGQCKSILDGVRDITESIVERTQLYCKETLILASGLDEEYERELEKQIEQEQERELPGPQQARKETDWEWHSVLKPDFLESCKSPAGPLKLVKLEKVLSRTHKLCDLEVLFPKGIRASKNFVEVLATSSQLLDDYLRLVDAILSFNDGADMILVSPREADHILPILRTTRQQTSVEFQHLGMIRAGKQNLVLPSRGLTQARFAPLPRVAPRPIQPSFVAVLQLFMGDCTLGREELKELRIFLNLSGTGDTLGKTIGVGSAAQGRKLAELLVALRGKLHLFTRSDLDKMLKGMTL